MKKRIGAVCGLMVVLLIYGCRAEEEQNYLIFGEYYGFCTGPECMRYYKVQNNSLYQNTVDTYPQWDGASTLEFVPYTGNYPGDVLTLASEIPGQLYQDSAVIGMPDAYDQGGYYVELKADETIYTWKIDHDSVNIPAYLHPFCEKMNLYFQQL